MRTLLAGIFNHIFVSSNMKTSVRTVVQLSTEVCIKVSRDFTFLLQTFCNNILLYKLTHYANFSHYAMLICS